MEDFMVVPISEKEYITINSIANMLVSLAKICPEIECIYSSIPNKESINITFVTTNYKDTSKLLIEAGDILANTKSVIRINVTAIIPQELQSDNSKIIDFAHSEILFDVDGKYSKKKMDLLNNSSIRKAPGYSSPITFEPPLKIARTTRKTAHLKMIITISSEMANNISWRINSIVNITAKDPNILGIVYSSYMGTAGNIELMFIINGDEKACDYYTKQFANKKYFGEFQGITINCSCMPQSLFTYDFRGNDLATDAINDLINGDLLFDRNGEYLKMQEHFKSSYYSDIFKVYSSDIVFEPEIKLERLSKKEEKK